jgi:ribosomal-protein-alanine N-acetyltransferase
LLRRPVLGDAQAILARYAADPVVTRYLSWPRHRSIEDTRSFLEWSDGEWERWPAGPYLVFGADETALLGSTGLAFESPARASTGYAFAQDAWGQGFATEALRAVVELARQMGCERLEAICHVDHAPSAHVLEKCGFLLEGILPGHTVFPNLAPGVRCDVRAYAVRL